MVLTTNFTDEVLTQIQTVISANFTYIGFGTGTTEASASDTDLEFEVLRNARQDIFTNSNTVVVSGFLDTATGNGNTITEVGAFDAASSGNLFSRFIIDGISKTSDKEIWVDEEIVITQTQD